MSDLCMYEFEDTIWDEFCSSDDHIVPHPCDKQAEENSLESDSQKKPRREVALSSSNFANQFHAGYVGKRQEQSDLSTANNSRDMMLEKGSSWSNASIGDFPSTNSNSTKDASSVATQDTRSSNHCFKSNMTQSIGSELFPSDLIPDGKTTAVDDHSFDYPLGDISQTNNIFDSNTEEKDSNDFLYYGWPDIGSFEDVDKMFRNCDSSFGLGDGTEDELSWFSSEDAIGGSEDALKSDVKYSLPDSSAVGNSTGNQEPLEFEINERYSTDSSMMTGPVRSKDCFWPSVKDESASHMSFINGSITSNIKDELIPLEKNTVSKNEVQPKTEANRSFKTGNDGVNNEHRKLLQQQGQSKGKRKGHHFGNGSYNYNQNLPNHILQLPGAISRQSFPAVAIQNQHQHQASLPYSYDHLQGTTTNLQSEQNHLPDETKVGATPGFEKQERVYHDQDSRSSLESNITNSAMSMQASNPDHVSTEKNTGLSGAKFVNHTDAEGVSKVIPAEIGSSNVQESSSRTSGVDDISLEAASFRQLQHVMEQLDLRTKLCIRDSLYRLARSAEQRHNHADLSGSCAEDKATNGASMDEGTNKCAGFMDIETDTNPIDRSIAHLLFHRPSDSSALPSHDSAAFKPMVNGSMTNMQAMGAQLITYEERPAAMEKK